MVLGEQSERGGDHGARREAGEDALLPGEPPGGLDRVIVGDGDVAVDEVGVEERQVGHRIAAALDPVVRVGQLAA